MSKIMQTMQCTFLMVLCVWFLYQIHHSLNAVTDSDCHFLEEKLANERIAKVLGRKGGVFGRLNHVEEVELYGVDVIEEAVTINNVTDSGELENANSDDNDARKLVDLVEEFDRLEQVGSPGNNDDEEEEAGEIESVVNVTAVILKKADETGFQKRESGPSKRSDVQVKRDRKGGIDLNGENQTVDMDECLNVCSKNVTEKEMPEIMTVESGKGSMRDILWSEL